MERGLKEWGPFLKPGGYVAVTEASWFTPERPAEIDAFWKEAYPGIDTIPNNVAVLERAGYIPVAVFILPDNCRTDHFYIPRIDAQRQFSEKYPGNRTAEELVVNQRYEAQLYDKYSPFYGYVFYIGKKR